jgi:aquaporin rerated protein, other eukaryote
MRTRLTAQVTLGLCLIGAVGWIRGIVISIAQIVGAIAAAGVVHGLFPGPILYRTSLNQNPHVSLERGVFIEMFLTAELIFTM